MVMTPNSLPGHPAQSQTNISSYRWDFPLGCPSQSNQIGPKGQSLYPFTSAHGSVVHPVTQARNLALRIRRSLSLTPSPADSTAQYLPGLNLSLSHHSCHAGVEDVITPLLSDQQSLFVWTVGIIVSASLSGYEELNT